MKLPIRERCEVFFFDDFGEFDDNDSLSETIKVGAFVESVNRKERLSDSSEDIPFSNLLKPVALKKREEVSVSPPKESRQPMSQTKEEKEDSDNGNISQRSISNEDFIMVDLKTPFAGSNANTELGAFYRECQSAPQLSAFGTTEATVAEQVGDLASQLEAFEASLEEYDSVITELSLPGENNN